MTTYNREDLQKILEQPGYGIIEDGQVMPALSRQEKTDQQRELERQRRAAERAKLERKFELVAIGCAMQAGIEIEWKRNLEFDKPDSGMQFDFSLPALKIAVEVNGGQGRGNESGHSSWNGLERDARKVNAAILKGWRLFIVTTSMVNAEHIQPIINLIGQEQEGRDDV